MCALSLFFSGPETFLSNCFLFLFHDTKTLDPKWNEEFFFQVSKP